MDYLGLNNSQFADKCNVPRPSFSQIITGRNKKVSDILLTQIHNAFPKLNLMWLLFGDGSMLVDEALTGLNSSGGAALYTDTASKPDCKPYPLLPEENTLVDITDFAAMGADTTKFGRENEVFSGRNMLKDADIQRVADAVGEKIEADFQKILDKPKRKVVRITVFYDDNSYETFSPTDSGQI